MPSTATITAFYSFTANTKARASQVNGNFDVFRGHFLPIHPNTQTSINNTYDLGSTEYYWRTTHTKAINKGVVAATSAAAQSGYAQANLQTGFGNTTVATNLSGSTLTIVSAGEPIEITFQEASFGITFSTATGAVYNGSFLEILRNGSSLTTFVWYQTDVVDRLADTKVPSSALRFVDFPGAGTTTYSVRYYQLNKTNVSSITLPKFMNIRGLY